MEGDVGKSPCRLGLAKLLRLVEEDTTAVRQKRNPRQPAEMQTLRRAWSTAGEEQARRYEFK
jgi:hypothetical protein